MNKFEEICFKSCEDWVSSFSEDDDFEFSNAFENSIECIAGEMEKNKTYKLPRKIIKILIIAAIILSFVTTAFAIPNTRNYIIKQFKDHFSYIVADICEIKFVENIEVGFIPNGFSKTDEDASKITSYKEYRNGDLSIMIIKNLVNTYINYDNNKYEIIKRNDIDYIIVNTEKSIVIVWNDGLYTYRITGNIDKNILLQIAQNIT